MPFSKAVRSRRVPSESVPCAFNCTVCARAVSALFPNGANTFKASGAGKSAPYLILLTLMTLFGVREMNSEIYGMVVPLGLVQTKRMRYKP